jgi:hypothetical protein
VLAVHGDFDLDSRLDKKKGEENQPQVRRGLPSKNSNEEPFRMILSMRRV